MRKILDRLFGGKREARPRDVEWEKFQKTAKKQFRILKDKGLSIPVMTI